MRTSTPLVLPLALATLLAAEPALAAGGKIGAGRLVHPSAATRYQASVRLGNRSFELSPRPLSADPSAGFEPVIDDAAAEEALRALRRELFPGPPELSFALVDQEPEAEAPQRREPEGDPPCLPPAADPVECGLVPKPGD